MIGFQMVITGMVFSLLIVISLVLFYWRYKRHISSQELEISRAETDHQRALLEAVILSQENERRRIGMNLHDEVGTALSILRMTIDGEANNPGITNGQSKAIIDRVLTDVRNISHDLSPIKSNVYTFTDAVTDRCEALNASGKLKVDLVILPDPEHIELDETSSLALYRVISELINNTVRHAAASRIHIHILREREVLHIAYRDNGKGMSGSDSERKGMGMQNIESRLNMIGAGFRLERESGTGFCFLIECPLKTQAKTA